ncbi:MAG TPA: hypothetical protein VLF18_01290 [Tahibacter sp.]|uniref:hypothetical protein n=1 Tax=Tahibacter sp. TaxID=2056211 RepID=UPI002BE79494|nr:hypothetical protein [Tahibacter sp.]HSX58808.1 hypothetical protein [Tahibacter sp.]
MLQPEDIVGTRVASADELATYMKALEKAASTYFATLPSNTPRAGYLAVAVKPVRASNVWIDFDPPLSTAESDELVRRLRAVTPMEATGGPVVFALKASVDGAPEPAAPAPRIADWAQAAKDAGKTLTIDEVVLRSWKP